MNAPDESLAEPPGTIDREVVRRYVGALSAYRIAEQNYNASRTPNRVILERLAHKVRLARERLELAEVELRNAAYPQGRSEGHGG